MSQAHAGWVGVSDIMPTSVGNVKTEVKVGIGHGGLNHECTCRVQFDSTNCPAFSTQMFALQVDLPASTELIKRVGAGGLQKLLKPCAPMRGASVVCLLWSLNGPCLV